MKKETGSMLKYPHNSIRSYPRTIFCSLSLRLFCITVILQSKPHIMFTHIIIITSFKKKINKILWKLDNFGSHLSASHNGSWSWRKLWFDWHSTTISVWYRGKAVHSVSWEASWLLQGFQTVHSAFEPIVLFCFSYTVPLMSNHIGYRSF